MNLENLSKPELLMFFSVLEGELEARDVVIEALQAQHRDHFIQERYGKYDISDPFLALQRDCETIREAYRGEKQPVCTNPLSVLKVVMTQCKKMQERMVSQLSAAESRHRKVILDLEEERRRHAQDTAEGDDVTYMLEKERERLTQQLEFEKSQVKKVEKEQKKVSSQLEEERSRHKQVTAVLMKECKKATNKAAEEGQRAAEMSAKLEKEKSKSTRLEEELAAEIRRGSGREAQMEKQLSEFDTEKEQLRAKLNREENRTQALKEEVENLKKLIEDMKNGKLFPNEPEQDEASEVTSLPQHLGSDKCPLVSSLCQTESTCAERSNESDESKAVSSNPTAVFPRHAKTNGHCSTALVKNGADESSDGCEMDSLLSTEDKAGFPSDQGSIVENGGYANNSATAHSSASPSGMPLSPNAAINSPSATSSGSGSPCSSPVLTKRVASPGTSGSAFHSSYQAGLNQRFHAARFKFQAQAEHDQQMGGLQSPPARDLSPTTVDGSTAKQLARNTVTQVLSRFTSQPGALKTANNSPFGTDYRQLGTSPKTPTGDHSHSPTSSKGSSPQSPLTPGIKSPTISRAERGTPPPIPPKKPGLAQSPASPHPLGRPTTDGGHSQVGQIPKSESSASIQSQRSLFNSRETGVQEELPSKPCLDHNVGRGSGEGDGGPNRVVLVGTPSNETNPTSCMKLSSVSKDVCNATLDLSTPCGMNSALITPSAKEIDILLPTSS
ncbi:CTTNBP2 N-terminal like b [Callorhinchus milii]|nr:CTTNBP2 N-terminal like b [Callorhinchus milii]